MKSERKRCENTLLTSLIYLVLRVKELTSKHKFKCAAIAPHRQLAVTGDDNAYLNLWSFSSN